VIAAKYIGLHSYDVFSLFGNQFVKFAELFELFLVEFVQEKTHLWLFVGIVVSVVEIFLVLL
jgi:hypothetical protein